MIGVLVVGTILLCLTGFRHDHRVVTVLIVTVRVALARVGV